MNRSQSRRVLAVALIASFVMAAGMAAATNFQHGHRAALILAGFIITVMLVESVVYFARIHRKARAQ